MSGGHDQGSRNALVGDIADDDTDATVRKIDEVVEVAADLSGRPVVGTDAPAGHVGHAGGQELLLDQPSNPQLLGDPLPLLDLGGLLAHDLRQPQRRCRMAGQPGQEPFVVVVVGMTVTPRPQRQHTDDLTMGHDRHHQLGPRGPHGGDERGLDVDRPDVDRAVHGQQVGNERVAEVEVSVRHSWLGLGGEPQFSVFRAEDLVHRAEQGTGDLVGPAVPHDAGLERLHHDLGVASAPVEYPVHQPLKP